MDNKKITNEPVKKNRVALKVTGILIAIIVGVALLGYIFSKTVLPMMMYSNAMDLAQQGNYKEAFDILKTDKCYYYKDSSQKRGEYALKIGEENLKSEKLDDAIVFFNYAYNSENKEASQLSMEYFFIIGENSFNNGEFEKAKQYFNIAANSENPEIKEKANIYLKTPEME